jgi:hypothetical protein
VAAVEKAARTMKSVASGPQILTPPVFIPFGMSDDEEEEKEVSSDTIGVTRWTGNAVRK